MSEDSDGPHDFLAERALADNGIGAGNHSRGGERTVGISAVDENAWRTREALDGTAQRQAV
jgi:hypothetical protein